MLFPVIAILIATFHIANVDCSVVTRQSHLDSKLVELETAELVMLKGKCEWNKASFIYNCIHANFTEVPKTIPLNTKELYLDYNRIIKVRERDSRRMKQLNILSISENSITKIHPRFFWDLENLTKLILNGNPISSMKIHLFRPLIRLEHLELRYISERSDSFNPKSLVNMTKLKYLDLSWNRQSSFPIFMSEKISRTPNLEYLNLSNNLLIEPNSEKFRGLTKLKILDVSNNKIRFVEAKFSKHLVDLI